MVTRTSTIHAHVDIQTGIYIVLQTRFPSVAYTYILAIDIC